jgi:hypothetical protein
MLYPVELRALANRHLPIIGPIIREIAGYAGYIDSHLPARPTIKSPFLTERALKDRYVSRPY